MPPYRGLREGYPLEQGQPGDLEHRQHRFGVLGLGVQLVELPGEPRDRLLNPQRAFVQVDIRPAKADQLASPEAHGGGDDV